MVGTSKRRSDKRRTASPWPAQRETSGMPAALVRMSVSERERYVRWWIEESGLSLAQLREMAGAVWARQGTAELQRVVTPRKRRPARES